MPKIFARTIATSIYLVLAVLPGIGATPSKYLSTASTNSTLVLAAPAGGSIELFNVVVVNTTVQLYYLKLYDKATAPTCGTDIPVAVYPIPFGASNSGGGIIKVPSNGTRFNNGLGFCLVGGIADNDTSIAATGVVINLEIR